MKKLSLLEISEWVKTATLIIIHPMEGEAITIRRCLFEDWVNKMQKRIVSWPNADCESTADDYRQMSWDEYYQDEFIELDFAEYLQKKAVMESIERTINKIVA